MSQELADTMLDDQPQKEKINLLGLSASRLSEFFEEIGEKKFRATQIIKWIHQEGECDFQKMTNLSKDLRNKLHEIAEIKLPEVVSCQESVDGTCKWLIRVDGGSCIEMVYIPERERGTLCVSSQIGCALDCSFCATGKQGFNRDLTSAEIIGQLWIAADSFDQFSPKAKRRVSNVVMMGMGEPLMNFDNVVDAMSIMLEDNAYGLSKRRVTLSTSGVVPELDKLGDVSDVSLAISLHAPNDELRNELVPINRKYPLATFIQSAKTVRACRRALRDAGVGVGAIDNVVLVGGSTRTPLVRRQVADYFGVEPMCSLDPDCVVAMGAAVQADVLVGNKSGDEMLLLDVIPLSLGIETMGGLTEKIIHRNTTIPVAKAQEFTTYIDGQTAMAIHILQGERELVDDCRSLARFELRGIPPMVAGAAKIRVTYQVDADGLLNVTARELTSNVESRIEVKPSYGLAEDEITQMLQDSFSHAREDMQARALREQQVEADRMIEDLEAAIKKDAEALLSDEEIQCLKIGIEELATTAC